MKFRFASTILVALVSVLVGMLLGWGLSKITSPRKAIERHEILAKMPENPSAKSPATSSFDMDDTYECYSNSEASEEGIFLDNKSYWLKDFSFKDKYAYAKILFEAKKERFDFFTSIATRLHLFGFGNFKNFADLPTTDELVAGSVAITDDKVKEFYNSQHLQNTPNMEYEKVAADLKHFLFETEKFKIIQKEQAILKTSFNLSIYAGKPCPPITPVDTVKKSYLGAEKPQWQIVVFLNHSCVDCKQSYPLIEGFTKLHSESVQLVPITFSEKDADPFSVFPKIASCTPLAATQFNKNFHSLALNIPYETLQTIKTFQEMRELVYKDVLPKMIDNFDFAKFDECAFSQENVVKANTINHFARSLEFTNEEMVVFLNNRLLPIDKDRVLEILKGATHL